MVKALENWIIKKIPVTPTFVFCIIEHVKTVHKVCAVNSHEAARMAKTKYTEEASSSEPETSD